MSAQPRVPQVSDSDRPRTPRIDPASQAALERSGQDDALTTTSTPAGQEAQPTRPTVLVPTYQCPSPRQARIHELRPKAAGTLAYVEFTLPEFTPLTPNHRHPYQAHTAWEQPDHHTLADWYPDGKPTTLILWDRDRPDGQVVTATSVESGIRAAYRDCERQLRLKRHDVAVLLRKLETLELNLAAVDHVASRLQRELVALKAAPAPAAVEHPLDAQTLAILRDGWPKLTREGGYFAMLDGTTAETNKRFSFAVALLEDLANAAVHARGLAWQTLVRAHTGRLEA